jgi:hypothetical protein
VLASGLESIDKKFLTRYPEFRAYLERSREKRRRAKASPPTAEADKDRADSSVAAPRQIDLPKRLRIERAAVDAVVELFAGQGYAINSVETDNVGWDLDARRGTEILRIEVKGRSGGEPAAELTRNEYSMMKKLDPTYRLCVVTSALDAPLVHIFAWDTRKESWTDGKGRDLCVTEVIGARVCSG